MRKFPRQQIKAAAMSIGIGVAVFGVIAYAMVLLSVTQSAALKGQPPAITAAR
jgi:hypothetical protein